MADLDGANKYDIRKHGRWNADAVDRCYLVGIAREVVRVQAGFDAKGGTYFLKRDIPVPEDLERQIFPEADEWLRRQETGDGVEQTICAGGFLRLLISLRGVILQDAACLRPIYPSHPLFSHPLFKDPLFTTFERQKKRHLETVEDLIQLQLQSLFPHLTEFITNSFAAQTQQQQATQDIISSLQAEVAKANASTHNCLSDILSGAVTLRLQAEVSPASSSSTTSAIAIFSSSSSAAVATASASASASGTASTSTAGTSARAVFSMSRTITTVDQAWREWTEGLGNLPSVEEIWPEGSEALSAMKKVEKDRKFYLRQMVIISQVRHIMQHYKVAEERAVKTVEEFRISLPNKSLDNLRKVLPKTPDADIPLV
ncbi:hypothetical protein JCM11641_001589 [Rhodosporidiobolus odoratus]